MPNLTNTDLRPSLKNSFPRGRNILNWIIRHASIEISVLIALAIGAYFLGHYIFDSTVPAEGDVRSHIFKIEFLQSYLANFSWPQWNPYWYHGIPEDQYYPPGFYFLGALISFIFNGVVAYKILIFLAFALIGLAIYFFARRFLKFDSHLAIWCLVAYETSMPLLINFMYGEGPNLLGWSVIVAFLTIYLSQVMENKTRRPLNIIFPGAILGVAILIHPFPVIFSVMAVFIFHVVWLIHKRDLKMFLHFQLPYIVGVFIIGGFIGMYYWLPAFLTLNYSSPIYSFTKFQWPGGNLYLLAIIFAALAVTVVTRFRIKSDPKFDMLIVCFCLVCALGYGATRYLPFGLGSLVQEFRFATIIIPFFGILLIVHPLKFKLLRFKLDRLVLALGMGILVTALVFGLDKRESFISGFKAIANPGIGNLYLLLSKQFSANFPSFALTMFPYFTVLAFLALSLGRKPLEIKKSKPIFIVAGGVCLLLLTTFIPYVHTERQANIGRLYKYVDNYEQPGYAQIMDAASKGRVIVPMSKGYLTEGDSPVTFGWKWGVTTVNGPYNQGDPKFFKMTVHLEWEERWLNYLTTRDNLMQESAAKYIFIRDKFAVPSNLDGMTTIVNNLYGKLIELDQDVFFANKVTPILIDVSKSREVTEFFNILLPSGYKIVMVDVKDIPPGFLDKFNYVMVDDSSKLSKYQGKTAFLLSDSTNPSVNEDQGIISLKAPYLTYTNKIFYHGDEADGYMWIGWDVWPGSRITPDLQTVIDSFGKSMTSYLDKLKYDEAKYNSTDNRIALTTSPGFTLVKSSYFPYWKSEQGVIMQTTQGFMLVNSESENIILTYKKPGYYVFASVCSAVGLLALIIFMLVFVFWRKIRRPLRVNSK